MGSCRDIVKLVAQLIDFEQTRNAVYLCNFQLSNPTSDQQRSVPESNQIPATNAGGSILVRNQPGHRNSANRVEFAPTNQVIPLIPDGEEISNRQVNSNEHKASIESTSSTIMQSVTSPVKTLFSRGTHKKVERQTTFESTSSATAEELLRQVRSVLNWCFYGLLAGILSERLQMER